ncbi:ROK family protein [uncultured Robinsoniella sp.]|uniref:ROK family protein n=1 Tax=uncultured Robinsoniella sp. TaxID=904190 RepID=UPI00374E8657
MKKLLGIDIGGTKCAVLVGEAGKEQMKIIEKEVFETKHYPGPDCALEKIEALIDKIAGNHLQDYSGIGISCGGPLDTRKGCILSPPNLPGWDQVEITAYLNNRFGLPVYLQNDANAGALAEWKYGAGQGLSDMVFLTCGTGLGAGLILNGQLYAGCKDLAGEVGHVRLSEFGPVGFGKCGAFEGFGSGGGIAHLAELKVIELIQRGKKHPLMKLGITAKNVFDLAKEGDELCREVCDTAGEYLGRGIAILIDILNPQAVIGGSIFARNYDLLMPSVTRAVKRECLPASAESCKLLPAKLAESIGDMAALTTALGTG